MRYVPPCGWWGGAPPRLTNYARAGRGVKRETGAAESGGPEHKTDRTAFALWDRRPSPLFSIPYARQKMRNRVNTLTASARRNVMKTPRNTPGHGPGVIFSSSPISPVSESAASTRF